MKSLVIVESPTKAKTIGKFLGKDFTIKYSMGHVMDLPKSKLGVDIERNFTPDLEVVADKKKIISELRSAAKTADVVLLATDPDREGEAISANIEELLSEGKGKISKDKFKRIVFHEITETAVKEALTHPRKVDKHLVDAQIARRVLDRLVGYQLSPLLWQKVRRGLSAGRVQSIALRLIVEREREIKKFTKEAYWTLHLLLSQQKTDAKPIEFILFEMSGERVEKQEKISLYDGEYTITNTIFRSPEVAKQTVEDIRTKTFTIADVVKKESKRTPYAPYTTSTLQQDASRRFGFSGKRTMSLAQKLYEEGFITYHRTDSVTLSSSAVASIREYVDVTYGSSYLPEKPRVFTSKQKSAQEAHEGIRPTKTSVSPETIKKDLGNEYAKFYEMIWRRAVASQMAEALIESTTVLAVDEGKKYLAKASGSVLIFDGFLKVNPQALNDTRLPNFTSGEVMKTNEVRADAHETTPPPRYNDASLIGALEEKGIGRPSTYASIISTIVERSYVERLDRRFVPTSVGIAVNDFLVTNFSTIDDIPFTASMEDDLDRVADGKKEWVKMMEEFYKPFSSSLNQVKNAARVKIEVEDTGTPCPECQVGTLVVRTGRFGKFLSCGRFPECKFTKPLVEETNILCPKDGGKVIVKKTRKGRKFYGCSNYPNCDFAAWKLEDIKGAQQSVTKDEKASESSAPV
jgi:DNA topoisomerase I